MNRSEWLLDCLAEECSEAAVRVSKALRFGIAEIQPGQPLTNAERIAQEFAEAVAVMEMLEDANIVQRPTSTAVFEAKKSKVLAFLQYAESIGAVVPDQALDSDSAIALMKLA